MSETHEQLYRLLARFEQGPVKVNGVPWPRTPEGAALKAYLCPAGKWTIAFGCTKHPDGTPIREGDTITPDQVYPYTAAAVARVLSDIDRMVTRPLNKYQLAALGSFVFNLGGENLRTSPRLLPAINAGRWEDAADIMGDYYRAWGKRDHVENGVKTKKWHRMAMFGLRIRRAAEGCVLLGLDWPEACDPENISFPKKTEWQPNWSDGIRTGGRYFDVVQPEATPVSVIHQLALSYPLPPLDAAEARAVILAPTEPARVEVAPAPLPDSPAPTLQDALDTIPVQLDTPDAIEDEDVLVLGQPAEPEVTSGPKGSPPVSPQPIPAAVPSQPDSNPAASPAGSRPAPATVAPQSPAGAGASPLPPPKPPPVIAPKSIDIKAIPYGEVDPSNGAKNMTDSTRFVGMLIVAGGSVVQVLAAREVVSSTAGAIFFDLSRDPVIVALIAGGVIWAVGSMTKWWGRKVITKGMIEAKEVLK